MSSGWHCLERVPLVCQSGRFSRLPFSEITCRKGVGRRLATLEMNNGGSVVVVVEVVVKEEGGEEEDEEEGMGEGEG